jgi:tetratricopeptide (TPR) repeat protein
MLSRFNKPLGKRWLKLLLLVSFCLLLYGSRLSKALNFNLASTALSHWSFAPQLSDARAYLSQAIHWGEKSDIRWYQRGYATRTEALWLRVTDEQVVAHERAEAAYQRGQRLEHQQHYQAALNAYKQAVVDDEKCIQCLYALYNLSMRQGKEELAQQQQESLLSLEPQHAVSATLDNGVRLQGYDLDEIELERAVDRVSIVFYWKLPRTTDGISQWQAEGWTYIKVQQRLFQIGQIENLLDNGGMEWNLSTIAGVPYGYRSIFSAVQNQPDYQRAHYDLKVDYQRDPFSQVVVVQGDEAGGLDGLTSATKIEVNPDVLYILGGRLRAAQGGLGYLGGVWRDREKEDVLYWYTVQDFQSNAWQSFTAVHKAPPSAVTFTPLFLNRGSGEVRFDDLIFFELPFLDDGVMRVVNL